ncbi:hypothetical protein [Natrinema salinisoli]|uniref:hypothetical protein n=1 Tax=Natrinema salinisoli TaxID=2878535 RepID=UPI001CF027AF|nr:hypothetical protein [Natrinema salinisoli]
MATEKSPPSRNDIENRIEQVGTYSRAVRIGFLIILGAFVLTVVGVLPANLESAAAAIEAIQLPLIFVGLGLILYGIGMHLHLMHLNLVRQLQPEPGDGAHSSDSAAD